MAAVRATTWEVSRKWNATAEEQKKIAADIQVQFFRDVTHVPLGQFFQPAAFHKGLVDIQPGWPVMHSVRRA